MNALVTMEAILEPAAGVILSAESIFGTGQAETIVTAIESQVRAEAYDITTEDGRERVKSIAYKIARSKTTLDEIGKEHVADIKAKSAAIDKERKAIRDRLDALKEEVRGPLTAWEEAEEKRVGDNEAALVAIIETGRQSAGKTSGLIRELIAIVEGYSARDWQEFKERADEAVSETLQQLNERLAAAEQQERDQAELIELRRLKAEREEADRLAQQRAAAEREAAAAIERERERQEQAKRDQEAAVAAAIEAERIKGEQAKAAAVEAERRRQEEETRAAAAKKAAEDAAEQKRQANKRHREKIQKEIRGALTQCFPDHEPAHVDRIIEAISTGLIPHVSITY
jgi:colicin import membrane protein